MGSSWLRSKDIRMGVYWWNIAAALPLRLKIQRLTRIPFAKIFQIFFIFASCNQIHSKDSRVDTEAAEGDRPACQMFAPLPPYPTPPLLPYSCPRDACFLMMAFIVSLATAKPSKKAPVHWSRHLRCLSLRRSSTFGTQRSKQTFSILSASCCCACAWIWACA
jgi:hypothetical protein